MSQREHHQHNSCLKKQNGEHRGTWVRVLAPLPNHDNAFTWPLAVSQPGGKRGSFLSENYSFSEDRDFWQRTSDRVTPSKKIWILSEDPPRVRALKGSSLSFFHCNFKSHHHQCPTMANPVVHRQARQGNIRSSYQVPLAPLWIESKREAQVPVDILKSLWLKNRGSRQWGQAEITK